MFFGKLELFLIINALFFLVTSCILTLILWIKLGLVTSFLVILSMSLFFPYPRLGLWLLLLYLPFAGSFIPHKGYVVHQSFSLFLHIIKDFFYIPALLSILINTKILFILLISYNFWYYPLVVNPVNVYYWFFIGVLLKIPQIKHKNHGSNHNFFHKFDSYNWY